MENDSHYKKFKEYPIPDGCKWIFSHFLAIWSNCTRDFNGNVQFGFRSIMDYMECMGVQFTVFERKLLVKMKDWVNETIYSMSK